MLVTADLRYYLALTIYVRGQFESVCVPGHHIDGLCDLPCSPQGNEKVCREDNNEAQQDDDDDKPDGLAALLLYLLDLRTGVGLIFFDEEEEVEFDPFYFNSVWRDSLGVNLIFDTVYFACEDCFYKYVVNVFLEVGLWQIYDALFVDWLIIRR